MMSTGIVEVLDGLDLQFPSFDRAALRKMNRMSKTLALG
jgi:hypothetical protein